MKAWLVREKNELESAVVFAETRGKAKVLAMGTDACEDVDFVNIQVHRMKQADKYYKEGKTEMDWLDDEDRVALVKDCGFRCDPYADPDCTDCPASQWCETYQHGV